MQRLSFLVTPLLVIALCLLLGWWVTHLLQGQATAVPPSAATDGAVAGSRVDAVLASARLFGSRKPGVLSDDVRALGVVADASGRGSVIVSVDGQAPKVYRVGDTFDGRVVSAIRPDEIELEAGGARQVFRLPPARAAVPGPTVVDAAPAAVYPNVPEVRYQQPMTQPQQQPTSANMRVPGSPMMTNGQRVQQGAPPRPVPPR